MPCDKFWLQASPFTNMVDSPHKGPITRKMLSFDDVIMSICQIIANDVRVNDV